MCRNDTLQWTDVAVCNYEVNAISFLKLQVDWVRQSSDTDLFVANKITSGNDIQWMGAQRVKARPNTRTGLSAAYLRNGSML